MHIFDQMGFGEAVSLVQTIGLLTGLLFLSLPIAAGLAIRRGKRNRPGARLGFSRSIFWGWFVLIGLAVAYFLTGAWYGENGPPPQTAAAQAAVFLVCFTIAVIFIYIGLYKTTSPQHEGGQNAA